MKKILLSSLLAVMAVTSANAKIASTDYADGVAASEAAAAEAAAKNYTDGLTGDVVNSDYIKGLTDKTLTGAVENLDSRVKGLTGTGDQAAATKKELADGLATKLDKDQGADAAGQIQEALAALLAVVLQGGDTLEAGQSVGIAAGNDPLGGIHGSHSLHTNTAGEHGDGVGGLDGGGVGLQNDSQILVIADVLGGEDAGDTTLGSQLGLEGIGLSLGEADLPAAVAVQDEDLALELGTQSLSGFQFGDKHLTSSPLQHFCPS